MYIRTFANSLRHTELIIFTDNPMFCRDMKKEKPNGFQYVPHDGDACTFVPQTISYISFK